MEHINNGHIRTVSTGTLEVNWTNWWILNLVVLVSEATLYVVHCICMFLCPAYMRVLLCVQLVKDIRRLVDNGEFLANRHCKNSPVVKLIITLLLELITDHSREV